MLFSTLIRWSGLAAVVAGVLLVIADLMGLTFKYYDSGEALTTGFYAVQSVLSLAAPVLLLFALFGLYTRQSEVTGIMVLAGFLAAFVGTALAVGANWSNAFFAPTVAIEAPDLYKSGLTSAGRLRVAYTVSYSLYVFSWLLFGIATLRSRLYPRVAAILLMIGVLLILIPLPGTAIVFAVAVAWLGFAPYIGRNKAFLRLSPHRACKRSTRAKPSNRT